MTISGVADEILMGALARQWEQIRYHHRLALVPCGFEIHDGKSRLGLWIAERRVISLSREHVVGDPWLDVAETMLHEMAHQWVDEVQGGERHPHGPKFRAAVKALGGLPSLAEEEPMVVGKVRKLLALAGSSNQHEAEAAMAKAQRLMIQHRVDQASLEGARGLVRRQVGPGRKRQERWFGILVALLSRHFFVQCLQAPVFLPSRGAWGTSYEIAGRPEDVEMASYAIDFVKRTAERLWKRHRQAHKGIGRSRASFLLGVVTGFGDKLDQTAEEAQAEGLVPLVDAVLEETWRRRHPRVSRRSQSIRVDDQYVAGQRAGRGVVLHRPVGTTGNGGILEG